jgi:DNA topoisomerase-1
MKTAQELYEGVEIKGMGAVGLITYMRTDSLRISEEAREAAKEFIISRYGQDYVPSSPRIFKSKSNAQDAHEAIRPSMPDLEPSRVKDSLSTDQFKLYKLIWERFIASQMANALLDTVSADIQANNCLFKASGYSVKFDGYTVLYEEAKDSNTDSEDENKVLPPLEEGNIVKMEGQTLIEIKQMLKKTGYYDGEINDTYDDCFKERLKKFYLTENFDERIREDQYIDREVLEFLRNFAKNK